jgi:hypothetical protein
MPVLDLLNNTQQTSDRIDPFASLHDNLQIQVQVRCFGWACWLGPAGADRK